MRQPYADRFRLILNDLGASFAARGDDLDAIIRRADPALRKTDRVLAELARQNQRLAKLAKDSDTILAPFARERQPSPGSSTTPTSPGRRPPSAARTSRQASRSSLKRSTSSG